MTDRDQSSKEIINQVAAWEDVLCKTSKDPNLWSNLEKWWKGLVVKHEGIDDTVREMHINSFRILKEMGPESVKQMLTEYKRGNYPNDENLKRESMIYLFIAITQNHHNLW